MKRALAKELLEGIRVGKRFCLTSQHFEEEALAEDFSMDDVWYMLRQYRFTRDPEDRGNGMWRVRLDAMALDNRKARLVVDLSEDQLCVYVTIHAL